MKYVDLQVNGFMGVDFNDPRLPQEEILKSAQSMRADGVELALATIITGPLDAMCQCIDNVARAIDTQPEVAQTIGGLHIEGPFLSPVKGYIGAHPADCVLGDDVAALDRILTAGRGHVKLVTLAPEVDPQSKLTKHLVKQNILVAAGHTDASVDQLQRAIDAGLQLFTHIGNACPQICHRHDNILQRAMSLAPQLKITFIADGWHLPSFVVKNLLRCAQLEHLGRRIGCHRSSRAWARRISTGRSPRKGWRRQVCSQSRWRALCRSRIHDGGCREMAHRSGRFKRGGSSNIALRQSA